MPQRLRSGLPWAYGLGLLWLNAYLVRQVFSLQYTGATNSMHGFWLALGRAVGDNWLVPQWVPYWAGGMPVELTYAPLVPWLAGHFGIYPVMAAIYTLVPGAVFLMAWQLSGKPGWGFIAGAVYSLTAPVELLLPDAGFAWRHALGAQRMYLSFVWDEAPHQLAMALICLAVAAWSKGWRAAAAFAIAAGAMASAFGVTEAMLFGLCFGLAYGGWRRVAVTGVLGYMLVSPFYPPSMLAVLRTNGAMAPESAWTAASWVGLAVVAAGVALIWAVSRGWAPVRRFALMLAWLSTAIPVLYIHWQTVVLQQPGRYKCEMGLGLTLLAVFVAERVLSGRPRWLLAALGAAAIAAGWYQTVELRRYSKAAYHAEDPAASIEYRAAQAVTGTVFTMGSAAQWMNVYRDVRQYGGGSFATAPNPKQEQLTLELTAERSWERFVLRMQAVGVDEVLIPGRQSPEFWKPFATDVLAGHMPVAWEERDTRLYRIPRVRRTMAHSVPGLMPLEEYVARIEDPSAPELRIDWESPSHGRIRGRWRSGEMVLVHVNADRRWKAYRNGRSVPTAADTLGQLLITPGGAGELEIVYEGGWEAWLTRGMSLVALTLLGWCQSKVRL